MTREQVCRQRTHCLSCPLSLDGGKFCYEYTPAEIDKIMHKSFLLEKNNDKRKITSIDELLRYGEEEENENKGEMVHRDRDPSIH